MTIKEAIETRRLPNIKPERIFKICESLGIQTNNDLNFDLNVEQLIRLQNNSQIHRESVVQEVRGIHNGALSKYDGIIKKYDELSKKLEGNSEFVEDKKEIDELLKDVIESRKQYKSQIDGLRLGKDGLSFDDKSLNVIDKVMLESYTDRIKENSDALTAEYKKLDVLQNRKFKTKFKKMNNAKKIERTCKKIAALQEKQGKLATKQKRIVNKGSKKYINKKNKEMLVQFEELQRQQRYVSAKSENLNKQLDYKNDLKLTQNELAALEGKTGLKASIERMKLQSDERKLNKGLQRLEKQSNRLQRLKNKPGICNLSQQVTRQLEPVHAM